MTRWELTGDCRTGHVAGTHTRGDRLTLTLRFDGDRSDAMLALVEKLDGAGWAMHVRGTTGGQLAAAAVVTATRTGNVLNVVAVIDDTDALEAGDSYVFDVEAAGGTVGVATFLPGSTIYVEPDVTREEGS